MVRARREALAWCDPNHRDDTHRDSGKTRREGCGVVGVCERCAVSHMIGHNGRMASALLWRRFSLRLVYWRAASRDRLAIRRLLATPETPAPGSCVAC